MPVSTLLTNPLQPAVDKLNEPTSTAQQTVSDQNQAKPATKDEVSPEKRKIWDEFRQRIDICKAYRRKMIANWTTNIDYRRGKPFTSQTDEDQVAVNLDWSLTKAKQAALFSQVPKARIDHAPETLPGTSPWAIKFEHKLNDKLLESGIEATMAECIPDCVNAAGIAIALVSYEALTEDHQVPSLDLSTLPAELHSQILQSGKLNGQDLSMETVPHPLDKRYVIERISPADFLWPINFTGVNFDKASWLGRSGRIPWAEAVQRFKLTEEDKSSVLGEDRPFVDRLTHDVERDKMLADELVNFDEVFYHEFQYEPDPKSYSTIHHLVYVSGKEKPVIDEPWKGQRIESDHSVTGAQKFPLRVLTLAYLTDEAIPPSDSAIGRPQVNEINKARTQMIRQRERSLPVRTFDVNRLDPAIQQALMRGTWQAMIPVQGDGARIITEISRAAMPQENFLFDKIAKADLQEEWTMGPTGQQIEEAEGDPNQNKSNFGTQAGVERAKVGAFFSSIAEVLGGLLCLYEDSSVFGEGFDPGFSKVLRCSILTDSAVLLDAGQKLSQLNQFVNTYAKSGWIDIEPVLQEIATLSGLDPTVVIKAPQPKPPVEPNISLRLTGVEDMLNPLTLAIMIKSGQAPSPELIEQAKQLIQQSVVPPANQQPQQPGSPMIPQGAGAPGAPLPPSAEGPPPGAHPPLPPPPNTGEAHPDWTVLTQLNKRSEGNQS